MKRQWGSIRRNVFLLRRNREKNLQSREMRKNAVNRSWKASEYSRQKLGPQQKDWLARR
jgi:hypothetical protein